MTFLDLYGEQLDKELSSQDRTQLFTTVRRKQAINDAVRAFVRETEATKRYGTIPIVDGTAEYDIESNFTGFVRIAKGEGPSIRIVGTSDTRYIQGTDDFPQTSPDRLDWENPSWRAADAGTPNCWYIRVDGGARYLGCWPPPDVGTSETWTWLVPYIGRPDTLSADADVPFSFSGNAMTSLEDYHQALVHYAAAQLEPARKNYDAVKYQMSIYAGYVNRFKGVQADEQPGSITIRRNYFNGRTTTGDPRR